MFSLNISNIVSELKKDFIDQQPVVNNSIEYNVGAPKPTIEEKGIFFNNQHSEVKVYQRENVQNVTPGPKIISIGGGKGGIGKSFFAANISVSLAKQGYKVALIDLDLGASNLHTCLGLQHPKVNLFDFITNNVENLEDVGIKSGINNLTLYGGGQEFWQQIRPQSMVQKIRLISKMQKLNVDYVILDLGAGTHLNILDFFIFSHAGIVVVVPEPTSIENAYVFLKAVLLRRLQSILKVLKQEDSAMELIKALENPKLTTSPISQIQAFAESNPEIGQKILQLTQTTQLGVVLNQTRTQNDISIGLSMVQICQKYFGFASEFLGATAYDDAVWKSIRNRKVLLIENPNSVAAKNITEIATGISRQFLPINPIQKVNSLTQ